MTLPSPTVNVTVLFTEMQIDFTVLSLGILSHQLWPSQMEIGTKHSTYVFFDDYSIKSMCFYIAVVGKQFISAKMQTPFNGPLQLVIQHRQT